MGFKSYHPIVNVLFYISIVVFGILFSHPVCLMLSFCCSVAYYIKLEGKKAVQMLLCCLVPMLMFVTAVNTVFSHYGVTVLYTFENGNSITFEAMANGFITGIVTISVMLWFFTYSSVVTADKFMYVFGKRIPSIALIISMTLRFVPMYKNRLSQIADAQKGIGMSLTAGSIISRIKNAGNVLVVLITWSLENAIETSDSMRGRGYGIGKRKTYDKFIWKISDTLSSAVIICADFVLIFGKISGVLNCFYNPQIIVNPPANFGKTYLINEINTLINPLGLFGYFCLSAFALLCLLPLVIDIKEDIVWHKLKSKI